MIRLREKIEDVKIKELFNRLNIEDAENASMEVPLQLEVKTPYGFKKIKTAFRTENQPTTTTTFDDGTTLKTSGKHRVKVGPDWVHIDELKIGTTVTTEGGVMKVRCQETGPDEVLYDISVCDVHCYYSNGILSHNSWTLVKMGTEAMKRGLNVVYYTLELSEAYVGRRFDACLTGVDFQEVVNNKDKIRETVSSIPGKLKIKYFPVKTVSAQSLKLHIDRISMLDWKPDLVLVDYADIMRPILSDKNANSYHEMGSIYEELRMIAGELQLPIWTVSQSTRSGGKEDIIKAHDVADSFRKIMTADFVMSLSRKTEDKLANTARFHVIKNRMGIDGVTFYAHMNTSIGDIKMYIEKSEEGQAIKAAIQDGEKMHKKDLSNKFNEFLKKKQSVDDDEFTADDM